MIKNNYEHIRRITDEFCLNMGFEKSVDSPPVVDNGIKKPESILSKVKRQVYSGNLDFTLGKLNDLSRCALILNSYSQVPKILQKLSISYPSIVGHISRHSTGYIGIHLNFLDDNIPLEIQISTDGAWLVKQASEHVYKKHRDFEAEIPIRLKLIQEEKNLEVKNALIQEFRKKHSEYISDYDKINELFLNLHENTDLYENLPIIETMLLSFEVLQDKNIHKSFYYDKILEQRLIDRNGIVRDDLVLNNAEQISPVATDIQTKLIQNVNNIFNKCNKSENFSLTSLQQFIFILKTKIENLFHNYINKFMNLNIGKEYLNFIRANIDKSVIKTSMYILDNDIKLEDINIEDYINENFSKFVELNLITAPDQFINILKEEINKNKHISNVIKNL